MGIKSVRKPQPSLEGRWLWTVFLLVGLTQTVTGVVDVTIVSKYQFFDEPADTWLYCYYTGSLINHQNGYQFGVEVNTGSGTVFTSRRGTGEISGRWNVRIWDDSADFRVGAFSCRVRTPDNSQTEKAITFKMKSQADVWPVTFTVTANTGDPLTLQMVQKSNRTGTLVWRKGGVLGTVLTGQNGLNFTMASVRASDEGIYECYYQGDTDRKQGIMRLIVRGCAEKKWGPPACTGDCPVCYNGGVCDDNTGECVCPPGFHGQNCESACANNKIGTSCTRECEGGDCTGQLLCVMDPYGCSCAPGLMGIECNTVCPDGTYGAGCTQTCHCASGGSVCDVMTGVCSSGGCEPGWKGSNCQEACTAGEFGPDCTGTCHCADGGSVCDVMTGVCSSGGCEAGWDGVKCQTECPDGMYGAGCTQTCHCANGPAACDKGTGGCTGGCVDFWSGDSCQDRTATVSYEELFTKEEGHFFGDYHPDHIATYGNIDADECAHRCLQGYGSYDGVNPPCLSFNHRPAGSPEGGSARCWLRNSDKDMAASPGSEWDSRPYRNYYQRKDLDMLAPQDCTDIFILGIQYSHIYTVGHPQPFQAYCDIDTAGGGWTVIQRRQDGSVPFDKLWAEYEQGFGNPSGEYWLGLRNIHSLTTQKQSELYVYLEDWEMNSRFARYSTFSVGDADSKYTATIDGYSGNATDSLGPSDDGGRHSINNRQFSTTDQDNAGAYSNCAVKFGQGGWWYTPSCSWALLNGQYLTGCSVPSATCSHADGIVWESWRGYQYSLKKTVMMIRPSNVSVSSLRPCENGGTLTSGPEDSGLYFCACSYGWKGPFCEQERPDVTVTATTLNSTTLHVTWAEGVTGNSIGWSDPGSGTKTTAEARPPESVSVASIVGGTVSGAALLVIVLVTVGIICYRRHAAERQGPIGGQMDLTMITTDGPSDSGSAENPTCTELHEDNSPYETAINSIEDLVTVDDVEEFLRAKGFGHYTAAFRWHKIDGDAVMCLNDAVLAELVPEIGPRVKLQKALQELKDNQTYTSLLN
ncbi:uncharacterized protein LOC144860519 isoform X2 [Branchiostoma floridae x Branchiostoma japonicum]